ncbi:MAG: FliM/FliN family flagellar motor switch protein [Phycisphaerales bacterium]
MPTPLPSVMRLEVPIIVRLGERRLSAGEVVTLVPGSIIELPKNAEEELDVLVNNRQIGAGRAVKIGENFGVKITFVGDVATRVRAMGPATPKRVDDAEPSMDDLAEQLAAG